jgi:hypothetical protein
MRKANVKKTQGRLARLEDVQDLKTLAEMRRKPLKFRRLEDFLREHTPRELSPHRTGIEVRHL